MRRVLMLLGLALLPVCVHAGVPTDDPGVTPLDRAVQAAADDFFKDKCHVGASVGIYDSGRTYFYNFGSVSKTHPALPTRQSLYEIGSITKTFTGAVAAKALLDGRMQLDGDFRIYLKEAYPNLERDGRPITLRTLATHRSGLQQNLPDSGPLPKDADFDKLPFQFIAAEKPYDRRRYLTELHDVHLRTTPGETTAYSNIGIKLLGFGLENVYGRSYSDLVADQITRPLGMKRTGLYVSWLDKGLLMQGYGPGGSPMPHTLANAGAAGGFYSNTEDMMRYAAWQTEEADPVVRKAHEPLAGILDDFATSLIWDETTKGGERKIWHSGGVYGMSSQLILFPDKHQAYVLLANDGCFDSQGELHTMAMAIHAAQEKVPAP